MKILIVSTQDFRGGAAKCAFNLANGLRQNGHDVMMYVSKKTRKENWIVESSLSPFGKKINHILDYVPGVLVSQDKNVPFTLGMFGENLDKVIKDFNPDIINFHWVGKGFVSFKEIVKQSKIYPTVCTMHDWNLFSGGEFFELPDKPFPPMLKKLSEMNLNAKKKILGSNRLNIISPSRFVLNKAKESILGDSLNGVVIENGIDLDNFKIELSKEKLREKYCLDSRKKYLLFGAVNISSDRAKGYDLLISVLRDRKEYLEKNNIGLLSYGSQNPFEDRIFSEIDIEKKYLGYITDEKSMSEIYSMSDLLLFPSRIENFSLTIIESLVSGTRVLAFDVGGNAEIVRDGRYGVLVPPYDIELFGREMESMLKEEKEEICDLQNFSNERNCEKYIELFRKIKTNRS